MIGCLLEMPGVGSISLYRNKRGALPAKLSLDGMFFIILLKTTTMTLNTNVPKSAKKTLLVVAAAVANVVAMAQEKKIDVDINTNSGNWYSSPWVWVIGAAVFILLLVAILRGGGNKSDA